MSGLRKLVKKISLPGGVLLVSSLAVSAFAPPNQNDPRQRLAFFSSESILESFFYCFFLKWYSSESILESFFVSFKKKSRLSAPSLRSEHMHMHIGELLLKFLFVFYILCRHLSKDPSKDPSNDPSNDPSKDSSKTRPNWSSW